MLDKKYKSVICVLAIILISTITACCIDSESSIKEDDSQNNYSINNSNYTANSSKNNETPKNFEKKGYCYYVVDGDTIDVEGVGRVRFVGVNTPERGQSGYQEAKDFVKSYCLGKTVYLDVDDKKNKDKYGRTLAVVYVNKTNLNALLLKKGYAEIMYIPPSEFQPGFPN
ncbi:thermonuclease family protein [Methanobacterium alcaliphilum]|uniref:thermonuclease family protein n=1 Tax=Methanobacterium alcaliphilum TaxID=392018 RepID=UPI00200B9458|nr:thermonuclease family protein [Methanobacterium alcaliphilum]MCK9151603.1 thermonuclease family protein [Methanobacterium alcaliphilum]